MSCMFASQVSRYSNTGPSLRQAAATWSAGAAAPSLKPSRSWPNCFIDLANLPEHPKTSILRWHDDMGTSDFWMPVDSGRSLILDSLLLNYSWLLTLDQEHANDCSQWLIENRKQKELPRLTLFVDNPCLSIGNDVRCFAPNQTWSDLKMRSGTDVRVERGRDNFDFLPTSSDGKGGKVQSRQTHSVARSN